MAGPADLPRAGRGAAPPRSRGARRVRRPFRLDHRLSFRGFFETLVYAAKVGGRGIDALNRRLLAECLQLERDDSAGRAWSRDRYPGGYTSYASASHMYLVSPSFDALRQRIDVHVARFARALDFDLQGRPLAMTDCWVNIMPRGVSHGLHLHPGATLSGTYYVRTPAGAPGLKIEDPRLERFMAAPPRRSRSRRTSWVTLPARAGSLILFESWLRHEVAPNPAATPRVSISFNYHW